MKFFNVLFCLTAIFTSITSSAQVVDRVSQVKDYFLNLAADQNSNIFRVIEKTRSEKETGFCNKLCVIPADFSKYLKIVLQNSEVYIGTIRGDEQHEVGYERMTFLVFLPASEVYYGGRITTETTLKFKCTIDADFDVTKTNSIECTVDEKLD
jgi:hypothetical protein